MADSGRLCGLNNNNVDNFESDDILKSGGDKYVLDIIKTTTDSNVDLRQMVVRKLKS